MRVTNLSLDEPLPASDFAYLAPSNFREMDKLGSNVEVPDKHKVAGLPAVVLIDRNGAIVEHQIGGGPIVDKAIRAALNKLGIHVHS